MSKRRKEAKKLVFSWLKNKNYKWTFSITVCKPKGLQFSISEANNSQKDGVRRQVTKEIQSFRIFNFVISKVKSGTFFYSVDFCKNFTDISCVRSKDYPGLCSFRLGIRAMLRFSCFICEILSKFNRNMYMK